MVYIKSSNFDDYKALNEIGVPGEYSYKFCVEDQVIEKLNKHKCTVLRFVADVTMFSKEQLCYYEKTGEVFTVNDKVKNIVKLFKIRDDTIFLIDVIDNVIVVFDH